MDVPNIIMNHVQSIVSLNFTLAKEPLDAADETDALIITAEESNLHDNDSNVSRMSGVGAILYRGFIQEEFRRRNLPDPTELSINQSLDLSEITIDVSILERQLRSLSDDFSRSQMRQWVSEQANRVPLNSLDFDSFSDLLYGLFQEGGVTWERIIVLFYFCADLSVRAFRENRTRQLRNIVEWTFRFMTGERMLNWVTIHGGWVKVMRKSPLDAYKTHIARFVVVGLILLGVYIWRRR